MPYRLPMSIKNEADLKAFEEYLLNDINQFSSKQSDNNLTDLLKNNIGKVISLETVFGFRKGRLLNVGKDYIFLGCKNPQTQMLISFSKINSFILPRAN